MTARGIAWVATGFILAFTGGWLGYPRLFYRPEAQPMAFNHRVHTGEAAGLSCDVCHVLADDGRFEGIPAVAVCAGCHASPIGTTEAERLLVERYVVPGVEIPWKSYWKQPDNAWFSHAIHSRRAEIACEDCHGGHGSSATLEVPMVNRLSGYPAGVDRVTLAAFAGGQAVGMKMDRCVGCHSAKGFRSGCIACHR